MKNKIKQWLENNFLERRFGCVTDQDISSAIEKCFNDLQPQWVSVNPNTQLPESMFWVLMPCGKIDKMYFNDYMQYGGIQNRWQDLSGNDYSMEGTKCMEIKQPLPPSEGE